MNKDELKDKVLKGLKSLFKKILPYLMIIVYPTKGVLIMFYNVALATIKAAMPERSRTSPALFSYYFEKILSAKNSQSTREIQTDLSDVGTIIDFSKMVYFGALIIVITIQLVMIVIIPTVLFTMFSKFMGMNTALTIAGVIGAYYTITLTVFAILLFMNDSDKKDQEMLRFFIAKEFKYVYSKGLEIDSEVASLAMNKISETLLVKNESAKQAEQDLKILLKR